MSIEFKAEGILIDIIESFLPRYSPENIVLTFGLNLEWSNYDSRQTERKFKKRILLAIHRPSNYTKVLKYVLKEGREDFFLLLSKNSEVVFDLESDHDSCWRSDGFSFLFKSWIEAEKYFREKFKKDIRNKSEVSTFHTLDLFGGKPKFFNVNITKNNHRNYKLQFLNEVKMKFVK